MKTLLTKLPLLSLVALLLSSCSTMPINEDAAESEYVNTQKNVDVQIVATDLVTTLLQIPGYSAWSMTLQVSPAPNPFGESITVALRNAWYGIQRVKQDQGLNYVSYQKSESSTDKGTYTTFEITVRDVNISRDYHYYKSRWIPISPMRIKGVPPSKITMFDHLHIQEGVVSKFISGVEFHDKQGRLINTTERLVKIRNPEARLAGERISEARYLIMSRSKLFTRQRAVDNKALDAYVPVSSVVLKFPSRDNYFLGKENKTAIAQLVRQMSTDTDGFTIRGCSHGKSQMWDGTESASLERQNRVNRELLVSGVSHELIREKSCFDSAGDVELPKQSVVLTLRRKI